MLGSTCYLHQADTATVALGRSRRLSTDIAGCPKGLQRLPESRPGSETPVATAVAIHLHLVMAQVRISRSNAILGRVSR
jgi:hypothetical protein